MYRLFAIGAIIAFFFVSGTVGNKIIYISHSLTLLIVIGLLFSYIYHMLVGQAVPHGFGKFIVIAILFQIVFATILIVALNYIQVHTPLKIDSLENLATMVKVAIVGVLLAMFFMGE